MRLGLIARADSRGLGVQTKAFHDNMRPAKTLVVDCPSAKPLPLRRDWYPDATWIHGLPTAADFRTWLQGLDVVYTAETAYGPHLWDEAEHVGVRTVLHGNFEFLNRADRPTLWAAPSKWRFNEWPHGTVFLPVPITVTPTDLSDSATHFLHVVGRPAIHDRNGTADLLQALQWITSEITVTVRCQEAGYVSGLITQHGIRTPGNVTLKVESGDVPDNTDLYTGQHVLVLPRRFGGLCLPCNEALGAGMPVIMPNIDPNTWLPNEWLTPATRRSSFMAKQRVDVYQTDPHQIAALIDGFATDTQLYQTGQKQARDLADSLSWETLKPLYTETLCSA